MKRLKRLILSACFCLLIASTLPAQAQAASVGHETTVTYTKGMGDMDDGTDNMTVLKPNSEIKKAVQTGDDTSLTVYISMVIISAVFLLLILIADRKRREEEETAF